MNLLYILLKHLCLYSPRSAARDQTTNRLFIVLSCLTQKLNQYSSCFCFHAQCSVFSAVLAWCRGWDSWATIDTRLIIFHISYFSGPGDTSSALRRGPLVPCLWRHCKNSVKDQRRNLKWPQPAASWYKGRTWIISCYQLAINIFIKKKLNHFLSLP